MARPRSAAGIEARKRLYFLRCYRCKTIIQRLGSEIKSPGTHPTHSFEPCAVCETRLAIWHVMDLDTHPVAIDD